jgi:hypothetical protein
MGHARKLANRLNLARMQPRDDLSSSHYCLAHSGREYLVYLPEGGEVTIDLAKGTYAFEWINPDTGKTAQKGQVAGGTQRFTAPFEGQAIILVHEA